MSVPTNKNISDEIAPHISSALRDLQLGRNFFFFVGSRSKFYCSELISTLLYITEWVIRIKVYIDVFHDIIVFTL